MKKHVIDVGAELLLMQNYALHISFFVQNTLPFKAQVFLSSLTLTVLDAKFFKYTIYQ